MPQGIFMHAKKLSKRGSSLPSLLATALLATPLLASAGSWQTLNNPPPAPDALAGPGGAAFPMLLTDGGVIIQNNGYGADGRVFKLTPDANGSYVNGTWSELATMPYIPTYSCQAVLADGRVIIEGGEYTGPYYNFTLTNQGAIYDPIANSWASVAPPSFFVDLYPPRASYAPHPIGDSACIVLPDGRLMLEDKMSRQSALLNPQTMAWTETGAGKSDLNDEEGLTLLPNGKVLTVDTYTDYNFHLIPAYPADPTHSEIYDPATGHWSDAGSTLNTLTDPDSFEIGPAVLRPDGTVFAVGSQGFTSIYNSKTAKWSKGPRLPVSPQGYQYSVQDGAGALLPNGNVLVVAAGGPNNGGYSDPPVAFFEFDGTGFVAQPAHPNASFDPAYAMNLLVLPTGQVLVTDFSKDIEIYTPSNTSHNPNWAPVIAHVPIVVAPGGSYQIVGVRFNGMSQGSYFGNENQNATNYPLVRITNLQTGHVFYSRTHDHTGMAVASSKQVTTTFDVPVAQEHGASKIEVVANGIASKPVYITVQ
jgi:hypothetical protein